MPTDDFAARLKTGRNDDCPCGSGKKYKKCHLREDEEAQSKAMAKTQKEAADKAAKEKEAEEKKAAEPGYHPEAKAHKKEAHGVNPHVPKPGAVGRQVSTPRKAQ